MKTRPKRSARAEASDVRATLLERELAVARSHASATRREAERAKEELKCARKVAKQAKRAARDARKKLKALKRTRRAAPLAAKKRNAKQSQPGSRRPALAGAKLAPAVRPVASAAAPAAYEFGTEPTITPWGR